MGEVPKTAVHPQINLNNKVMETIMQSQAVAHLHGNIWLWIAGIVVAGGAAIALGWATPAAFLLMISGILIIMADQHVDPLAVITENSLDPD